MKISSFFFFFIFPGPFLQTGFSYRTGREVVAGMIAGRRVTAPVSYFSEGLKSQPGVVLATSNLVGLKMGSLRLELGS